MGAMFLHANRGKRSVVLDLKDRAGQAALRELLASADVFVHNIRPAAIRRIGLDQASVRAMHPAIVYAELTGYGVSGPYADRPAFDDVIQAESGLAGLFSLQTGGAPAYLPALIADRLTGVTAAHRILAALMHQQRTGEGCYLNVAMFETMAEFVLADHLGSRSFDLDRGEIGYSRLLTPYRRPYRTADGFIAAIVYNDKHWKSFFDVIGDPQTFAQDARFNSAAARADSYGHIYQFVEQVLAGNTTAYWLETLTAAEIPCAPVNAVQDLINDPQLRSTGFFAQHQRGDRVEWAASALPGIRAGIAPRKGEHTADYVTSHTPSRTALSV